MDKLSTNNWIVIGIGAAVVLLGGWWFVTNSPVPSLDVANTEEGALGADETSIDLNTVVSTTSDSESVSVADQPAGDAVTISSVTFTETGWIAVRDDRGWTLGAGRIEAGTHKDMVINLLRGTIAGERYQVLLYIDDGDQVFDLKKEILVTRSDGSIAGAIFEAQ